MILELVREGPPLAIDCCRLLGPILPTSDLRAYPHYIFKEQEPHSRRRKDFLFFFLGDGDDPALDTAFVRPEGVFRLFIVCELNLAVIVPDT